MYHPAQGFQLGGILQQHLVGNRGIVIIVRQKPPANEIWLLNNIVFQDFVRYYKLQEFDSAAVVVSISQTISGCWTHPLNFVKFRIFWDDFKPLHWCLASSDFLTLKKVELWNTLMDIKCEVGVVSSTVSVSVSYLGRSRAAKGRHQ